MHLSQPRKLLLLDLDGVVVRHPTLSRFVRLRAEQYVQHRLQVPLREAEGVNTALYTRHGHTWKGLQEEFGDRVSGSLLEYNNYVYNWSAMDALRRCMKDPELRRCSEEMKVLQINCMKYKVPIWVLSNAPMTWCLPVLSILDVDWGLVLSSDNPLLDGNEVKPSPLLYGMVANFVHHTLGPHTEVLFVDDSLRNVMGAMAIPDWRLFHYSENGAASDSMMYKTIGSLHEMYAHLV